MLLNNISILNLNTIIHIQTTRRTQAVIIAQF